MQSTIHLRAALPTGHWLDQERQRLGKTQSEVARAVRGHRATVRAMEEHNRALPPGWYPDLRELGMHLHEPVWPAQMPPYSGADLRRDMRTCVGFQHSRFRLSKMLYLPESAVTAVVQSDRPVPPSWLLKLAELGANVPETVRRTLHAAAGEGEVPATVSTRPWGLAPSQGMPSDASGTPSGAVHSPERLGSARFAEASNAELLRSMHAHGKSVHRDPLLPADGENRVPLGYGPQCSEFVGSTTHDQATPPACSSPTPSEAVGDAPATDSAHRERSSFFFHWTEEEGLHFSVSTGLLNQFPAVFQALLFQLRELGLLGPRPDPSAPTPGT